MRRNLKIVWEAISAEWTWHLTAVLGLFVVAYVLALLDYLGAFH